MIVRIVFLKSNRRRAEQKYKHRLLAVYFVKEANDFTNVFSILPKIEKRVVYNEVLKVCLQKQKTIMRLYRCCM